MARNLSWKAAKALALTGVKVRRAAWEKWLRVERPPYLWFIHEPVVAGSPTRERDRVAQTYDFGKAEFEGMDWTDEPWDGDPGGGGPPTGGGGESEASGDDPVVSVTIVPPRLPVCLEAGERTDVFEIRIAVVGGAAGVHELTGEITGEAVDFTADAYDGYTGSYTKSWTYEPGDTLSIEVNYTIGMTTETETVTWTAPAECAILSLAFTGTGTTSGNQWVPPSVYASPHEPGFFWATEEYSAFGTYKWPAGTPNRTFSVRLFEDLGGGSWSWETKLSVGAPHPEVGAVVYSEKDGGRDPLPAPNAVFITTDGSGAIASIEIQGSASIIFGGSGSGSVVESFGGTLTRDIEIV